MNTYDTDLGVGGALLLPDQPGAHPHLMMFGGKDATIYVLDRDNLGHYQSSSNSQIVQSIPNGLGSHCHMTPVYWNGLVFFAGEGDVIRAFKLSNGLLNTTPVSKTAKVFAFPGTNPSLSANGSSDGILWAIEKGSSGAVLHAYNPNNLAQEYYNSTQAGTRDSMATYVSFTTPTVANGKVYVGTKTALYIFGLLQ
jgi:hypothetical protein